MFRKIWRSALVGWASAALLLTACQPTLTPVARATPQILTAAATPALQSLRDLFTTCNGNLTNTGLVLLDTPAPAIDLDHMPFALRWGAASQMPVFAAVLGQETLVAVVNPRNPLSHITLSDLQAIYSGAQITWNGVPSPAEIQAWAYPKGDDVQAIIESEVLGAPASPRVTHLAPDPAALRQAVAENQNAIGFLPQRWVDATVKALPVAGIPADQLRKPILILSKSEPKGPEKSWLLCVQNQLKG